MRSDGEARAQYRALRESAGIIPDSHELVWVTGSDTISFLDGLLSQDIAGMSRGEVAPALLLSPQGKLRATMSVLRGEARCGLLTDRGGADTIASDLKRFRIRVDVEISAPAPVSSLWGPHSSRLLASLGLTSGDGWTSDNGTVVAAALEAVDRWLVSDPVAQDLVAAGAVVVGDAVAVAVRVEAGWPQMGMDIDDSTIPQEAGLVHDAVSLTKGCFLGQELVARIDSRGHVNRHLRGLVVAGDAVPVVGARVSAGDNAVGTVSSVAVSPRLEAPVALALLRREVEPGDSVILSWGDTDAPAAVHALPIDAALAAKRR